MRMVSTAHLWRTDSKDRPSSVATASSIPTFIPTTLQMCVDSMDVVDTNAEVTVLRRTKQTSFRDLKVFEGPSEIQQH
jgi:hypothetical protein